MSKKYDVIITGARCAGSSLAIYLAKVGFRVLLIDRSSFPSDTLSTHTFFNNTTSLFREMGVLDKLLETNAPPVKDIKFQFEDTTIEGKIPEVHGEENCYCIRRTYLDHILLEHVKSLKGVTVLEGFRVTDIIRQNGVIVGIKGTDSNGLDQAFFADFTIGADGRNSTIRRLVGAKEKILVPSNVGIYYGYFHNFNNDTVPKFEVHRVKDNTSILFPTNDDLCTVVGIFPLENKAFIQNLKNNPEESLRSLLTEGFPNTTIGSRLNHATLVEPIKGILGYENFWYTGMGHGWALVGDAVCFKDPSMAQGIHDAVYGAKILSGILVKYKNQYQQWLKMAEEYQNALEDEFMVRFYMGCEISKNERISEQQNAVNKLISSHPKAVEKFLGIYNYTNEPADLEKELLGIMG